MRSLRLVFSEGSDAEASKAALREWIANHVDREVTVDAISHRLDPNQLSELDIEKLSAELKHIDRAHLAVDITGGTKVMTVAAYHAQMEGQVYGGLFSIHDPESVFEWTAAAHRGN